MLNGFEHELRSRMLTVTSHATITRRRRRDRRLARRRRPTRRVSPECRAVVPFIESRGLLANGERVAGAMVRGILPEEEARRWAWAAR